MAVSGRNAPSMLVGSDAEPELYCVPCDEQGTRIQAYGYCVDCSEHLCETCYQVHTKPTPSRNHVLLDKSRMPKSQSLLGCSSDIPTHCGKHEEKSIEYNCKDHDTLVCNVCVAMEHRNCKVDYIPDVTKGYTTSTEYMSIKESVTALQMNIDEAKSTIICHQQEIEENRRKVKQDIKQYRISLDQILDKWEEDTIEQADIIFDGLLVTCKTVEEECKKLLEDLHSLQDLFKSVDDKEQLLYVCVRKYSRQISEQRQKFAEFDTDCFYPDLFMFQPSKHLQTLLQSDSKLGSITKRNRAEQILAKRKEIKEVEGLLGSSNEARQESRGLFARVSHQTLNFVLKTSLERFKKELLQLEEAEREFQSLN